MFHPLALFIGLRYIRAKRHQHFISFIAMISMLGIALGVTVLITVLSVLNGFDREIKKQIFSLVPPITINSFSGEIEDWPLLSAALQSHSAISATAPFTTGFALLANGTLTQPVTITGILPEKEAKISALASKMIKGKLTFLKPGSANIILGQELANRLNLKVGDTLTVVTKRDGFSTAINFAPRLKTFTVTGLFRAGGGFSFDTKFAFIHLSDAQQLFGLGKSVTAIHANINDIYQAPIIAQQIENELLSLAPDIRVISWVEQLGDFFQNIRATKTMMFFIFVLIIAVAAFNLICTMVMTVKNKRAEVAILRTFGATPKTVMGIFIVQGAAIGLGGTLLGLLGGLMLAYYISPLSIAIQQFFNVKLVNSDVYFVNYLPSAIAWPDVLDVCLLAFLLSLFATLYPAWRASYLNPAETLRGE